MFWLMQASWSSRQVQQGTSVSQPKAPLEYVPSRPWQGNPGLPWDAPQGVVGSSSSCAWSRARETCNPNGRDGRLLSPIAMDSARRPVHLVCSQYAVERNRDGRAHARRRQAAHQPPATGPAPRICRLSQCLASSLCETVQYSVAVSICPSPVATTLLLLLSPVLWPS